MPNLLTEMLPDFSFLEKTIRVIDVRDATRGKILRILMNAELGEAVAMLTNEDSGTTSAHPSAASSAPRRTDDYWKWRMQMAERIAAEIDPGQFGVQAFYVFGSTKNASAGPGSDIDILVHFRGNDRQRHDLEIWLDGWNLCLIEINYLRTGYRCDRMLDVHFVTDEDIKNKTSYAVKIGAVTDAARELPIAKSPD